MTNPTERPDKREQAIRDRLVLGYRSLGQAENDIRSLLDRLENARHPTERPDDLEIVWQLADRRGEELQHLHRTLKKIATGKFSKDTMRMMAWEAIKHDEELKALMANG